MPDIVTDIGQVGFQIIWVPAQWRNVFFSPRFKSAGFVNADADINDDGDLTVRTNSESHAELNQWL